MWGGRVRLAAPWRKLHTDLDLGFGLASAHDELGDVLFRSVSVGVGVGPRFANRIATLDIGLRSELGWAWVRGETDLADVRAQAGSGWTSSAGMRASVDLPASLNLRPGLAVESGWVVHGVKGEAGNRPVVGMAGYYLLAALSIVVSP